MTIGICVRITLAVGAAALLTGCDSFYTVRGRVVSCAQMQPIEGATVHLHLATNPKKYNHTDSHEGGRFQIAINEPPGDDESHLIVAAPGYKTTRVVISSPDDEAQVCLPPAEPIEGEPHP